MHSFVPVDARILYGIFCAPGIGFSYSSIALCSDDASHVPGYDIFAEAFNKFLYIGLIAIDGETVSLAPLGREIIARAQLAAGRDAEASEIIAKVFALLSRYKLKSMCNRKVWSEAQHQLGLDHYRATCNL